MNAGRVLFGVDRLLSDPRRLLGPLAPPIASSSPPRIGLFTHDGAFAGSVPSRVALLHGGLPIVRLFSPEHGLSATAPDGVSVPDGTDVETGVPVTSMYGPSLRPDRALLEELDLVLVDIQDIGVRFYTYLWSLTHLMEGCAEAKTPLMILDRPNPLGGRPQRVEGPLPDPGSPPSFLCRWPVPIRHSLTIGEMARLVRAEMGLALDLRVVPLEGWERAMLWPSLGRSFRPPSPGIPSFESALLYPGLALLEATNVHEGRGTDLAFRWLGASWMNGERTAEAINRMDPSGIRAHAHALSLPNRDSPCPGTVLVVSEPERVRPVSLGLRLLAVLRSLWPDRFSWTPYPTAVNPSGEDHLLRLLMKETAVDALERIPEAVDPETVEGWTRAPGWWERAAPHLLYD